MPVSLKKREMTLEKYLINFINQMIKPFMLVDQPSFLTLFNLMDDVTVSSRKTIQRSIADLAGDKKARLKSFIHRKTGKVSLTADAWSSKICPGTWSSRPTKLTRNGR